MDPNARNLAIPGPDTGQPHSAVRPNLQLGQCIDQGPLHLAEIPVKIRAMRAQIEDRVSDQLARPMVSHIAAALYLEHFQPACYQLARREDKAARTSPSAQGDHGIVLDQEEKIGGDLARHPSSAEIPLQLEDLAIAAATQVDDLEGSLAHRLALRSCTTFRLTSSATTRDPTSRPTSPNCPPSSFRGMLSSDTKMAPNPLTIARPPRR